MGRQKEAGKTIGEVEQLTGIPKRTLKYYIERGLLAPSRKSPSGYWLYGEEDLERLRLVFLCRELGCADGEIRALLAAPEVRWQEELDRRIARLAEDRGRAEDRLVAAELMRCRCRAGGMPDLDAGALSPALGALFEDGRPPRLGEAARRKLCQILWEALREAAGGSSQGPDGDSAGAEVQARAAALCGVLRERAGLPPEEALFALRLAGALSGMELLLDAALGQSGAVRALMEAVEIYCDNQR